MTSELDALIDRIGALPEDWHGAGTVGIGALRAIAAHAARLGTIEHSMETGAGKTSLLFSHLSADHRVFAVDYANSVTQVRRSPLLNAASVTFVEGPTQVTLPAHVFPGPLQIALIDGPHGYPFPDLEYFYVYPRLATGGLLLVDDIPIPTIARMFEIIKADPMFELLEVADGNMAIFRRTDAPLIDPHSDSWWLQGYNRAHYARMISGEREGRFAATLRLAASRIPKGVKDRVPAAIKARLWKKM